MHIFVHSNIWGAFYEPNNVLGAEDTPEIKTNKQTNPLMELIFKWEERDEQNKNVKYIIC